MPKPTVAEAHTAIQHLQTQLADAHSRLARLEVLEVIGRDHYPEVVDLAMTSEVARELLRQGKWAPKDPALTVTPDYSLTRLWRVDGSDPDLDPRKLYEPGYQRGPSITTWGGIVSEDGAHGADEPMPGPVIGNVVDKGDQGLFADWAFAWRYARMLDSDITEELECDLVA